MSTARKRIAWFVATLFAGSIIAAPALADFVINDDLIVTFSTCIGNDCVSGESFGFDTLRLKENNTRIKFDDTSASASFPRTDWQLTANETTNGGAAKFSIENTSDGKIPFTLRSGAPSNSLYVDDQGDVGLNTSTPTVELHIRDGDTPTARLEQDGSAGFQPQTWDLAGNETNFFVRDVSNGSTLPFRIRPSAPTSSIDIAGTTGHVGFGEQSPDTNIHVKETGSPAAKRDLFKLENNGAPSFLYENTATGVAWEFSMDGVDRFQITKKATGGPELRIAADGAVKMGGGGAANFNLDAVGNLVIAGTLTESSDQAQKTNITPLDGEQVLAQLDKLPISVWSYTFDPPQVRHAGPMAQDFRSLFGLGTEPTSISSRDMAGIALAAIKVLNERSEAMRAEIAELKAQIAARDDRIDGLEARLERIEARLD